MYAIVETGGKQYKVAAGQTLDVEMLPQEIGSSVELDKVLMVADGDKVVTGQPVIKGAKVNATVLEQGKGKKIIVLKYKNKTRYSKKTGHRQLYTKLSIDKIVTAKK